jgi:hypothetical protein
MHRISSRHRLVRNQRERRRRRWRLARNEIAQPAYRLDEANGRQDGHGLQDWLLAEQMLAAPDRVARLAGSSGVVVGHLHDLTRLASDSDRASIGLMAQPVAS